MITIKNLSFAYKRSNLFNQLDLEIEYGKIHGLLGKNGAGKTTLIKLIAGLQYPKEGSISIDKDSSIGRNPNYLSKYFFVTEEFSLPSVNIKTYINIYAPFYKNFDKNALNNYLDEFKIPKENKLNKMSYGQKKKFLLSFGLATNSKILFMDEPTNGLDIPSKSIFRKLIAQNITEDRAFIISTHQIKDIEGLIDTVVILEDGKIMFNQEMMEINKKIVFKTLDIESKIEHVLYSEENIMNKKVIAKNKNNDDSPIDIELLFNAVISENQNITQQFQTK